MIEPTGPQLKSLAKCLLFADKQGFTVAVEQMAPKSVISLWKGDKSYCWVEILPNGRREFTG